TPHTAMIPSTITNRLPAFMIYQQIPYETLSEQKQIGHGASGTVVKAQWGKLTVAIKYMSDPEETRKELNNLAKVFGGENIIRIHGLTEHAPWLGIVMEYCTNGTLHDYLASNFQQFIWEDKLNMAQEIARGLRFIHEQGLLHRDLHDGNILIDDGGHALI